MTSVTTRDGQRFDRDDVPLSLVISRAERVDVVDLEGPGAMRVGREAPCEIRIDDPSVSRVHARIDFSGAHCELEDVGSRNGTRVNGAVLAQGTRIALSPGMVVSIGDVVALVRPRGEAPSSVPLLAAPRAPRRERDGVVVMSPAMHAAYDLIELIAPSKLSVLILGETGVGKDVYAEALFANSGRKGSLLRVNCASLPETLLEAELFGYERGAFTGALAAKQGLFESADGGAVFLDEIGDMPLSTQSKLLRVLENGEVLRLGSLRPKKIDVRFLSATHRDLETLSGAGLFRSDLYFRLNGVSVSLPPLRERLEEVLPLARGFIARSEARTAVLSPAAEDTLERHAWLGNVRELKNVVERAALLCRGQTIMPEHLLFGGSRPSAQASSRPSVFPPPPLVPSDESASNESMHDALADVEKKRILRAMAECKGNQTQAARMLGIARGTLIKRLSAYGYARPFKDRG